MRVLGRYLRRAKERAHGRRAGALPLLPRAGSPLSLVEIPESSGRRGAPVAPMTEPFVAAEACAALAATRQQFEPYPGREVEIGDLRVLRALPVKGRRLIGPWCFLDRWPAHLQPRRPDGRGAASAHGTADGDLAARRRSRPRRQPSTGSAAPTRRAECDDVGRCDRACGADARRQHRTTERRAAVDGAAR